MEDSSYSRASELGGKDLELIDIHHDGCSVEHLQAVVKLAQIYVRPLQQDLDNSQLENMVVVVALLSN